MRHPMRILPILLAAAAATAVPLPCGAQPGVGTAINYQGFLNSGGSPATGPFDFEFAIWDDPAAGLQVAAPLTVDDLAVTGGLFTTPLDFGPGVFDGAKRWLEIRVRAGASAGAYTPLTPRVELMPVPHALFAAEAGIADAVIPGAIKAASFAPGIRNTLEEADGDPDAVFVDASGNVGINQVAPLSRLHIDGDGGAVNAVSDLMLLRTQGDELVGISLVQPFANWLIGQNRPPDNPLATDKLFFFDATNEVTRFLIDPDTGHAGIGTTTPMARLHVAGTPGVDGIMFPDGTLQTSAGGGGDRPAVAVLEADRRTVQLNRTIFPTVEPAAVTFDLASLSYDPEGGAVEYGFDPRGDQDGQPAYGPSGMLTYNYEQPGHYLAEGWVRDAGGGYDVDRVLVEVIDAGPVVVDAPGDVGMWASMRVVNGVPAIAYYDSTDGDLLYVRAMNAEGTNWHPPVTLDSANNVGEYCSLAVVGGFPAVSYYDRTTGDLKYVRATDADGTAWSAPVNVFATGDVGQYTSLSVVNGNPAISFRSFSPSALIYVRATTATGSVWGTPVSFGPTGSLNPYTSLVVVAGNPAIAYVADPSDISYVRALDVSGASWGTPVTLDSVMFAGGYVSMAVVAGNPAVAFHDASTDVLRFRRATNSTGSAWGAASVIVDSAAFTGQSCSLAVIGGLPAISYHDVSNWRLRYAVAADAAGAMWTTRRTVDDEGIPGRFTSLAEVAGAPAIAYYETLSGNLKFAR